ncbi:bis-aminopropyl spermidine synthase family protein [Planomonospora algeriensis]
MNGIEELLRHAGVDGRRLRTALALLGDGRWWTLADLVRETATSRRAVEALLRAAGAHLERSGDRFRLRDPLPGLSAAPHGPADPVAHLLGGHADLLARMEELVAKAPRGRQALDHVAATADTVVRRALLMDARFWLPGARILCVGDHDLTSLATALLRPDAEVAVVDVDERILAYIAEQAERLGVSVRTRWADLRLGLPASVRGWADLAVTDPPYTPEGIGLFAARAAEGIADREHGRVLLAYGAGEHTPALALKVQQSLSALNLVSEAIYPDFNRYHGAEAIGSAATCTSCAPRRRRGPPWPPASTGSAPPSTPTAPSPSSPGPPTWPPTRPPTCRRRASPPPCSSVSGRATSCRSSPGPGSRPGSPSRTPPRSPRSRWPCRPGWSPCCPASSSPPGPAASGPGRPRPPRT